jgi:hypothetical protein
MNESFGAHGMQLRSEAELQGLTESLDLSLTLGNRKIREVN